jgi:hypothetical protein
MRAICLDYSDHPAVKAGLLHTGIAVSPRLEQSGKQLGQAMRHVIRHDIDIHSSSYQPATVTAIDRTRAMSASMLETSTNISFELCHQLPNGKQDSHQAAAKHAHSEMSCSKIIRNKRLLAVVDDRTRSAKY